ncbi:MULTISPECIES: histidine phosphatase family protein [Oceanobacillus]|uniref:Phosphoglycerate mutase n=1 Tax=Oceanobacillus kimchii TaxID=746691 RepID=A0ABQ5TP79_9BACI|nr:MULTISPECIES: histidine phosphatase family protein [Oceanobacillus]MBT2598516.1 histidine phosphatase family protein [Oceanobacillus sp. ISL-74]MBT2651434.1 histidine phosphatase family protein [Oceanobacillus sp. ISL-73]OEH55825.1 phosphoglycerate mutase [Oceanobacillus sp. E9]GLO66387.1 phosphoglycerate mutase [Oceanobacillus kimchii]
MKKIYFIRHCSAEGQHPDAPLTYTGLQQAKELSLFLQNTNESFCGIWSSPYLRAIDTIKPFSNQLNIEINIDDRLKERVLCAEPTEDWMDALKQSFEDPEFYLPGGESASMLLQRANAVLTPLMNNPGLDTIIIVSHGNILSHLFQQYNNDFGFEDWKTLGNPDVYVLDINSSKDMKLTSIYK